MGRHTFTVCGTRTLLDGQLFQVRGLRCSNALVNDAAADSLIRHLPVFAAYGVNTVSVFFQGSRFGDVHGYRRDGTLNPVYAARMGRVIEAADAWAMVVLVGCLYWGDSRAKWDIWTQSEANAAVRNKVAFLGERGYGNALVDVDNEGMALRAKGFDNRALVLAGKRANPERVIGTNFKGEPPPEADLGLHFATPVPDKPYIESEGSAPDTPVGYWGDYSKRDGFYGYLHVGVYTPEMQASQVGSAADHFDAGHGYLMASTWLQAPPGQGPRHYPGGDGTVQAPGIRWWLFWLRRRFGPYPAAPGNIQATRSASHDTSRPISSHRSLPPKQEQT